MMRPELHMSSFTLNFQQNLSEYLHGFKKINKLLVFFNVLLFHHKYST